MELGALVREARGNHIEALLLEVRGLREPTEGELTPEARSSARAWLNRHDLITSVRASGHFRLAYMGEQLADELHRSRTSGEGRWDRVTRVIAEEIEAGGLGDGARIVDGADITEKERAMAYDRLERWQLVTIQRAWGGVVVRASARSALSEVPHIHGLLKEHYEGQRHYVDQRVMNETNVHGGTVGAVMTGGEGNAAYVTQTLTAAEQVSITAKVAEILDALDGVGGAEGLRAAVEAIQEVATQPEPSKSTIRQKVFEAAAVASATVGVEKASHLLIQLVSWAVSGA